MGGSRDAVGRWALSGSSMRPLGTGWHAHVARQPLVAGDLVCYLSATGHATVHRVIEITPNALLVRGDTARPEPLVGHEAVIGRVVALERAGLTFALPRDGLRAVLQRRLGLAWSRLAPTLQRLRARRPFKSRKV